MQCRGACAAYSVLAGEPSPAALSPCHATATLNRKHGRWTFGMEFVDTGTVCRTATITRTGGTTREKCLKAYSQSKYKLFCACRVQNKSYFFPSTLTNHKFFFTSFSFQPSTLHVIVLFLIYVLIKMALYFRTEEVLPSSHFKAVCSSHEN